MNAKTLDGNVAQVNLPAGSRRGAFTLIELLMVIAIIGILMSLALLVGGRVRTGSQISMTKDLLKVLDQAYTGYSADRESKAPYVYRDDNGNEYPVCDARVGPAGPIGDASTVVAEPSVGLLVLATGRDPSLTQSILGANRFVTNVNLVSNITGFPTVTAPQLKDPWGNLIRFVHPKYQGGYGESAPAGISQAQRPRLTMMFKRINGGNVTLELRRSYAPTGTVGNTGDGDEGLCTGGRGYFYSAGPDGDPGTRSDNVYIDAPPSFPSETANFN